MVSSFLTIEIVNEPVALVDFMRLNISVARVLLLYFKVSNP